MSKGNRKRRKKAGLLPVREKCLARNRRGERCKNWPIEGGAVCRTHGGAAPQVKAKAQQRILMAQDDAANVLIRFMSDPDVPYGERRRCAEFLLTYETRNEVKLMVEPWLDNIEGILIDGGDGEAPRPRAIEAGDDVIDAEVISDSDDRLPALTADPPRHPRGPRLRGQ